MGRASPLKEAREAGNYTVGVINTDHIGPAGDCATDREGGGRGILSGVEAKRQPYQLAAIDQHHLRVDMRGVSISVG
jgi:hypothetical protein